MLTRLATPDLWIAGYYHNAGQSDMLDLQNLPDDLLLADHVLLRRLDHGLAETHMHFHAGMNYRMLWELVSDMTALQHNYASLKRHGPTLRTLLMAGLLRLFLAEYLNICPENQDFMAYLQDYLARKIPLLLSGMWYTRLIGAWSRIRRQTAWTGSHATVILKNTMYAPNA